jgi:hypothetical protein
MDKLDYMKLISFFTTKKLPSRTPPTQMLVRMWGTRNPHILRVEMSASATTMENIMEAP